MIESNKLMAEFLGYKYYPYSDTENYPGWRKESYEILHKLNIQGEVSKRTYLCRNHKELSFDTDWNWLMQVVEKIEENYNYNVYIRNTSCSILSFEENFDILDSKTYYAETKIQAVYSACLQFIQNVTTNT